MAEPRSDLRYRMGSEHEKYVARLLGASTNAGSGNQWHARGDGQNDEWGFDCKSTRANSMSIGIPMLDKLTEQVYPRKPLLPVRFYSNDRLTTYRDYVLLGLDDFVELHDRD